MASYSNSKSKVPEKFPNRDKPNPKYSEKYVLPKDGAGKDTSYKKK